MHASSPSSLEFILQSEKIWYVLNWQLKRAWVGMFQTNETHGPTTSRLFSHFQAKLSTQRGYPLPPLCDPCPKFHPCRKWILGNPLNIHHAMTPFPCHVFLPIIRVGRSAKISLWHPLMSSPSSPVLSAGVPAEFKSYPSMGHAYCPEASFLPPKQIPDPSWCFGTSSAGWAPVPPNFSSTSVVREFEPALNRQRKRSELG